MNINLSSNEKLIFISNLATMLTAGIPILEAIDSLREDAKGSQKKIVEKLKNDVGSGKALSTALSQFPKAFDSITVNLIKAAEESGTLDTTLKDLTISVKKDIEFSSNVRAALIYPVLVLMVFAGVLLLILTFVIPRIASAFTRLRLDLPLPTKILIFVSNIFTTYTPYILIGLIFLILSTLFLYRIKKELFINVLISFPVLSRLAREIDFTRFTRSMFLLLSSGIPITEALELSHNMAVKREVKQAISDSKKMVSSGKKLSEGFRNNKKVIPVIMIRITEAGEKSGTLNTSMQELSEHFDSQVSNSLRAFTALLEPVLLVIIGLLVGGIMLAIIGPIYRLIGQISVR